MITLAAVPALLACRDRTDGGRGSQTPTARAPNEVREPEANPGLKPSEPATRNPEVMPSGLSGTETLAQKDEGKIADKGLDKSVGERGAEKSADFGLDRSKDEPGSAPKGEKIAKSADAPDAAFARIHARGALSFTGSVKVHDVTRTGGLATISLTRSTPGTYVIKIFDAADCDEIPMVEIESGKVALGDKAGSSKPAVLADAGEISVGKDGKGRLESSLTNMKPTVDNIRLFENKAVGIYEKKPAKLTGSGMAAGTSTGKRPEACGVLTTTIVDMTQG